MHGLMNVKLISPHFVLYNGFNLNSCRRNNELEMKEAPIQFLHQ